MSAFRQRSSRQDRCDRNKQRIWEIKASSGCLNCGEQNPEVLQFHHRDPAEKKRTIGGSFTCRSWSVIQAELDKCNVLCANCHILTHKGLIPQED